MSYPPSQRRLAQNLSVNKQTVTDWKYARGAMPDPEVVERVASELRVPFERVLDAFLRDHGYRDALPEAARGINRPGRLARQRATQDADSEPTDDPDDWNPR